MNKSYWILSSRGSTYDKIQENIEADILVVGGGIVGMTTAYLLGKQGKNVVLVEADKIGYGSSGRNTGKVSTQHGIIYSKLEKKHNLETSYTYYEINQKALQLVETIALDNKIECNLEKLPSYVFTQEESLLKELEYEYSICKKIGIDCEYHSNLELPIEIKGALSFNNQLQINPKKYLDGLGRVCHKLGVKIYENTPITNMESGDICVLKTDNNKTIKAKIVIIASHFPWYDGMNFYFAKEKGDRSYLMGAHYKEKFQPGMFISMEEPTRTFRIYEGDDKRLLIIGGNDHKVGQGKIENDNFDNIKDFAKVNFNVQDFDYKWSAQDYMSFDNLPYIGHINKKEKNVYIATGFSKWGLTNGTASSIIISEMIINNKSKYENIFKPYRKESFFTKDFIKENMNVAYKFIGGKLNLGSDEMPMDKGEGKIVNIEGKRYGAYRHFDDKLYIVDITCTHLRCELKYNSAEQTWDCPCHASRFNYNGDILEGPALEPLKVYEEYSKLLDIKDNKR